MLLILGLSGMSPKFYSVTVPIHVKLAGIQHSSSDLKCFRNPMLKAASALSHLTCMICLQERILPEYSGYSSQYSNEASASCIE